MPGPSPRCIACPPGAPRRAYRRREPRPGFEPSRLGDGRQRPEVGRDRDVPHSSPDRRFDHATVPRAEARGTVVLV